MSKPHYKNGGFEIYHWPEPCCEIVSGNGLVSIRNPMDAIAIINSLQMMLDSIGGSPESERIESALSETMAALNLIENRKKEWPDESRIDAIGQNGGDGAHYSLVPHEFYD